MKRDYIISVAMATYNGERFIADQLDSILKQLGSKDEVIISDDGSTDDTIKIIKSFKDKRVKIIDGPKKGIKKNFENAISKCKGEIIFLSDQDDIWMDDKVERVLDSFNKHITLVQHDCEVVDLGNRIIKESFFNYRKCGEGLVKNIYKNTYIGCCIAFRKSLVEKIIPIPDDITMHDQWIGLMAEKYGNVRFINYKLIKYKRHEETATDIFKHGTLKSMIKNRFNIIKHWVVR